MLIPNTRRLLFQTEGEETPQTTSLNVEMNKAFFIKQARVRTNMMGIPTDEYVIPKWMWHFQLPSWDFVPEYIFTNTE